MLKKLFEDFDWFLFLPTLFLSLLSILIIQSVAPDLVLIHVITLIIGFFLFFEFSIIDYRLFENFGKQLYVISVISLLATFVIGIETRGSMRWIEIGSIRIQASELIKPLLIIFFSCLFNKKAVSLKDNIKIILLFLVPAILVFNQPDLGNALVYTIIFFGLFYISGIKSKTIVLMSVVLISLSPVVWNTLKDYQKTRLVSFLNPLSDPLGSGYNAFQASIAVGSGGLWGRGLGWGTQSHLKFLPEFHTDFIFASISEELGVVGAMIILLLYLIILIRLLLIAKATPDRFSTLVIFGVFLMILSQVFINIGMNIGLVPITGITLPLVSYGNNSILATLVCLGLASSISKISFLRRIRRPQ